MNTQVFEGWVATMNVLNAYFETPDFGAEAMQLGIKLVDLPPWVDVAVGLPDFANMAAKMWMGILYKVAGEWCFTLVHGLADIQSEVLVFIFKRKEPEMALQPGESITVGTNDKILADKIIEVAKTSGKWGSNYARKTATMHLYVSEIDPQPSGLFALTVMYNLKWNWGFFAHVALNKKARVASFNIFKPDKRYRNWSKLIDLAQLISDTDPVMVQKLVDFMPKRKANPKSTKIPRIPEPVQPIQLSKTPLSKTPRKSEENLKMPLTQIEQPKHNSEPDVLITQISPEEAAHDETVHEENGPEETGPEKVPEPEVTSREPIIAERWKMEYRDNIPFHLYGTPRTAVLLRNIALDYTNERLWGHNVNGTRAIVFSTETPQRAKRALISSTSLLNGLYEVVPGDIPIRIFIEISIPLSEPISFGTASEVTTYFHKFIGKWFSQLAYEQCTDGQQVPTDYNAFTLMECCTPTRLCYRIVGNACVKESIYQGKLAVHDFDLYIDSALNYMPNPIRLTDDGKEVITHATRLSLEKKLVNLSVYFDMACVSTLGACQVSSVTPWRLSTRSGKLAGLCWDRRPDIARDIETAFEKCLCVPCAGDKLFFIRFKPDPVIVEDVVTSAQRAAMLAGEDEDVDGEIKMNVPFDSTEVYSLDAELPQTRILEDQILVGSTGLLMLAKEVDVGERVHCPFCETDKGNGRTLEPPKSVNRVSAVIFSGATSDAPKQPARFVKCFHHPECGISALITPDLFTSNDPNVRRLENRADAIVSFQSAEAFEDELNFSWIVDTYGTPPRMLFVVDTPPGTRTLEAVLSNVTQDQFVNSSLLCISVSPVVNFTMTAILCEVPKDNSQANRVVATFQDIIDTLHSQTSATFDVVVIDSVSTMLTYLCSDTVEMYRVLRHILEGAKLVIITEYQIPTFACEAVLRLMNTSHDRMVRIQLDSELQKSPIQLLVTNEFDVLLVEAVQLIIDVYCTDIVHNRGGKIYIPCSSEELATKVYAALAVAIARLEVNELWNRVKFIGDPQGYAPFEDWIPQFFATPNTEADSFDVLIATDRILEGPTELPGVTTMIGLIENKRLCNSDILAMLTRIGSKNTKSFVLIEKEDEMSPLESCLDSDVPKDESGFLSICEDRANYTLQYVSHLVRKLYGSACKDAKSISSWYAEVTISKLEREVTVTSEDMERFYALLSNSNNNERNVQTGDSDAKRRRTE